MSEHEGAAVWGNEDRERQQNEGARMADDHWCQVCGARGFVSICPGCDKALAGTGR